MQDSRLNLPAICNGARLCKRLGLSDLTQHLLEYILAKLDPVTLMTARLVSRAFRAASLPHLTTLSFGNNRCPLTLLPQRLQALSLVTNLQLHLSLPQLASALELPAVLSSMQSLHLTVARGDPPTDVEGLAARIARATALTSLLLHLQRVSDAQTQSPTVAALSACRRLRSLSLSSTQCSTAFLAGTIVQLTGLESIHHSTLEQEAEPFWEALLPCLGHMPKLQALGWVQLSLEGIGKGLAHLRGLTGLTRLDVETCVNARRLLPGLPLLQRLTIHSFFNTPDLRAALAAVPHLRDLGLCTWDGHLGEMDGLVASLSGLSRLTLGLTWEDSLRLPAGYSFRSSGVPSLKCFSSVDLPGSPEHLAGFAAALTGAESIVVKLARDSMKPFLEGLGRQTQLTTLQVTARLEDRYLSGNVPPGFLARLTGLSSLHLQNVLDVASVEEAVQHVAALTGLTSLVLEDTGSRATGVTSAQLQPLTALRRLAASCPRGFWCLDSWLDYKKVFDAGAREMGIPFVPVAGRSLAG